MAPLEEPPVDTDDRDNAEIDEETVTSSSSMMTLLKLAASCAFLFSAVSTLTATDNAADSHRRLTQIPVGDSVPSYMTPLLADLKARNKLMKETPPEEVKYWFEYTGPLQVSLSLTLLIKLSCGSVPVFRFMFFKSSQIMLFVASAGNEENPRLCIVHPKSKVILSLRRQSIRIAIRSPTILFAVSFFVSIIPLYAACWK
jgi:hypothetical protein